MWKSGKVDFYVWLDWIVWTTLEIPMLRGSQGWMKDRSCAIIQLHVQHILGLRNVACQLDMLCGGFSLFACVLLIHSAGNVLKDRSLILWDLLLFLSFWSSAWQMLDGPNRVTPSLRDYTRMISHRGTAKMRAGTSKNRNQCGLDLVPGLVYEKMLPTWNFGVLWFCGET